MSDASVLASDASVLAESANVIHWPRWGCMLRVLAETYSGSNFTVVLDNDSQVAAWARVLGLKQDAEQLAVVVTLALIAACVVIVLIAAFAGIVGAALALGYEVDANLDADGKTINFDFKKVRQVDLPI